MTVFEIVAVLVIMASVAGSMALRDRRFRAAQGEWRFRQHVAELRRHRGLRDLAENQVYLKAARKWLA